MDSFADRCGGSAGWKNSLAKAFFLLPVELRPVNQAASTNPWILDASTNVQRPTPTISAPMAPISLSEQVAERVERLLARHTALQQSHQQLADALAATRQERDALRQRLEQANARVNTLLEQLPQPSPEGTP